MKCKKSELCKSYYCHCITNFWFRETKREMDERN